MNPFLNMDKKFLQELTRKLKEERDSLKKQLQRFAKKDPCLKDDWDTRFPKIVGSNLEEAVEEVEEYGNLLTVEHTLELKLQNVNLALEKIKKGKYGICEKCKKEINRERLKVCPEAKTCLKCI